MTNYAMHLKRNVKNSHFRKKVNSIFCDNQLFSKKNIFFIALVLELFPNLSNITLIFLNKSQISNNLNKKFKTFIAQKVENDQSE